MAPFALPHCLWLPNWHHQLVLIGSTSSARVTSVKSEKRCRRQKQTSGPKWWDQGYLGPINIATNYRCFCMVGWMRTTFAALCWNQTRWTKTLICLSFDSIIFNSGETLLRSGLTMQKEGSLKTHVSLSHYLNQQRESLETLLIYLSPRHHHQPPPQSAHKTLGTEAGLRYE